MTGGNQGNTAGADLWRLPEIAGIEIVHAQYPAPIVRYEGGQRLEYWEAVELLVQTITPFPVRALSPALFVDDTGIGSFETLGENLYRFFAFDFQSFQGGETIFLGWPQAPEQKVDTGFTYQPPPVA
jgi:hypothetical protein